jgi:hypothetical protein
MNTAPPAEGDTARQTQTGSVPQGMTVGSAAVADAVQRLGDSLLMLAQAHPELAWTIAQTAGVVAAEAARSPRFARAIVSATQTPVKGESERRHGRRAPGPFDPFALYAEIGEQGLRGRLSELPLEQLRNILAEHRMDHDRLAMKWKDTARVVERIIERVKTRSAKGDVFRTT